MISPLKDLRQNLFSNARLLEPVQQVLLFGMRKITKFKGAEHCMVNSVLKPPHLRLDQHHLLILHL